MDDLIEAAAAAARSAPHGWSGVSGGALVRLLRDRVGLKQWHLADRAGLRQSTVSEIERGSDLRLGTLKRLLDAMGFELLILPLPRVTLEVLERTNRLQEVQRRLRLRRMGAG